MRSIGFGVVLLTLAAPLASVHAQDTIPERPFVRGGVYDKPYLARLLGRAAIGGYAEAHVRFERVDGIVEERGFQLKRFNLFASTEVSDFIRLAAEVEFEEGAEEIKLEFAAIDFRIHQAIALRAGMLLSPIGRFNLSHDSPINEFTDRPLVSTDVLGTALSEPGIGALGVFPLGGLSRITYELYLVNGFHSGLIDNSPDGTRIFEGRGNFEDNNRSPAVVGRVTWSPDLNIEIGLSAHHGAYNEYSVDGVDVEERRNVTLGALDFEVSVAGWRAAGEAALADVDIPPGLVGINASGQRGLYVEVLRDFGYGLVKTMPSSFFSAGVRVDVVDFDTAVTGDNVRQLSLGVNFRPTPESVVKLNYVRGRSHDRFNNPADHARVQLSLATYF